MAEAIPAAILQIYALLTYGASGPLPYISITTSILTIAYGISIVSYDKDVSPESRVSAPHFYGFVPDKGRASVFVLMILFSACTITLKVIGVTFLLSVSPYWVIESIAIDYVILVTIKFFRDDLRYFLTLPNVASWCHSLFHRLTVKLAIDFTAWVQGRVRKPSTAILLHSLRQFLTPLSFIRTHALTHKQPSHSHRTPHTLTH